MKDLSLRVLVIIPCYNEEGSISELLTEIELCDLKFLDVLVIDDCSTDRTYKLASLKSDTISLPKNLGIGGAVQTGIRYAFYNDYEICIQLDGDGQHPPEEIKKLLKVYQENDCSIVVGSRYLDKIGFQSSLMRRFGSKLIGFALQKFLNSNQIISDPTSGFRLLDKRAMSIFSQHYPTDFPEPITLAWALRRRLSIIDCSVNMRNRHAGTSSISSSKAIIYMIRVLCYVILSRFRLPFDNK